VYAVHLDFRYGRVYVVYLSRMHGRAAEREGVRISQTVRVPASGRRVRVNRDRALRAAVALADEAGLESLTMRSLAQELGVVPMALYKHVANRDDLIEGMVDIIVGEIDPAIAGADWKSAVRERILSARRALLRHPWARAAIESRTTMTPVVLGYMESMIGLFRAGGFSVDLTHHVLHALAGRIWGFTQDVFAGGPTSQAATVDAESQAAAFNEMATRYPYSLEMAMAIAHDETSVVGGGCDDQFEFEFALDILLDGFERLHRQGWTSIEHHES
jgi:AcrR family transcriptional regulator